MHFERASETYLIPYYYRSSNPYVEPIQATAIKMFAEFTY